MTADPVSEEPEMPRTPMDEIDPMVRRLYATTDASVWGEEFCVIARAQGHDLDNGWVIGWFANAIETAKAHEREAR